MARLDRLAPIKDILQVGACIGREFSFELLAEVSAPPADELSAALDQFTEAELIFRRGDPPAAVYTFKHALVQDAAYSSLLRTRRAEIHGTIAGAIEATFPDTVQAQPEIVAHHLTEAGLIERAIPMWEQAGRDAARKFANTEAIRHFNKALELLGSLPDDEARKRRELAIQINLGPVYMTAKGFGAPEVGAAYARARDLAKSLRRLVAVVHVVVGTMAVQSDAAEEGNCAVAIRRAACAGGAQRGFGSDPAGAPRILDDQLLSRRLQYTSEQAEQGRELYDASEHRTHKFLYGGHDPGVCSRMFGAAQRVRAGISRPGAGYDARWIGSGTDAQPSAQPADGRAMAGDDSSASGRNSRSGDQSWTARSAWRRRQASRGDVGQFSERLGAERRTAAPMTACRWRFRISTRLARRDRRGSVRTTPASSPTCAEPPADSMTVSRLVDKALALAQSNGFPVVPCRIAPHQGRVAAGAGRTACRCRALLRNRNCHCARSKRQVVGTPRHRQPCPPLAI